MVLVTAISGLVLAHSSSINPRYEHPLGVKGIGRIEQARPINDLLIASLNAVQGLRLRITTEEGGVRRPGGPAAIDRALFRPASGTVQVLLRDPQPLEVVLDWQTSQVLSVAPRHAQRWLRLHTAEELLGEDGTFKRDAIAGVVVLLSLTGIWIWFRNRRRTDLGRAGRLHRLAGLVAGIVLLVPATTGILMNHRVDLGFAFGTTREIDDEQIVKRTPARLSDLVDAANKRLASAQPGATVPSIDWLEYFPRTGFVTIGFHDGTDIVMDVYSAEARAVMPARGTWVRQLHSGRIFGAARSLFTGVTALLWIAVTFGGLYVVIRSRRREGSTS